MMEVKHAGRYKTKLGREVEIYGFGDLGGAELYAEGFCLDDKLLRWWKPENGELVLNRYNDEMDIVERLASEVETKL